MAAGHSEGAAAARAGTAIMAVWVQLWRPRSLRSRRSHRRAADCAVPAAAKLAVVQPAEDGGLPLGARGPRALQVVAAHLAVAREVLLAVEQALELAKARAVPAAAQAAQRAVARARDAAEVAVGAWYSVPSYPKRRV